VADIMEIKNWFYFIILMIWLTAGTLMTICVI